MKTFSIFVCLTLFTVTAFSQNIFKEKFEGCNTDQFALESDTITAIVEHKVLIETVLQGFSEKDRAKLSGTLQLQIIVDLEGNSCLISIENETNIKSKRLNLKEVIDTDLKWQPPAKKVAALVHVTFKNQKLQMTRIGLDGKRGMHKLREK